MIYKLENGTIKYGYGFPKMTKNILLDDINQMIFIKVKHKYDETIDGFLELQYNEYENQGIIIKD